MIERPRIGDRFELIELIDKGGMGTVYRALDTQTGETVAVKALKPDLVLLEPAIIDRFKREGEALRQLNHPAIVKVIATIEQDNKSYIVMEFIGGGSLDKLLRAEKSLSVERTIQIALDIADALTRAHRLKIIHRDIKPANVLLADDGTPRLTDFGVVQFGDAVGKLTELGMVVSTISYLAPEVVNGGGYDERSDIWSFGVMLYEMLSGSNPFSEATVSAALDSILTKVPRDLTDFRTDVPSDLAYLIDRMIAKDPSDRIDSARTIGAELETVLAFIQRAKQPSKIGTQEITPRSRPESFYTTPVPRANPIPPAPPISVPKPSVADPSARPSRPSAPTPGGSFGRMIVSDTLGTGEVRSPRKIVGDPRMFIAYRREDSGEIARKIYDLLHKELGDNDVARDVDRVANRTINRVVLAQDIVQSFDAMIVVIGRQWMGVPGSGGTNVSLRALENPKDSLRIQLEAGLKRDDMLIVPVLVDGADMPTINMLPPSLHKIVAKPPFHLNWTPAQSNEVLEKEVTKLTKQIRAHFNPPRRSWVIPVVVAVVIVLVVTILIVILLSIGASSAPLT